MRPQVNTKILPPLLLLLLVFGLYGTYVQHEFMIDDFGFTDAERLPKRFTTWTDYFTVTPNQHYNPFNYILNVHLFRAFPAPGPLYGINVLLFYGVCLVLWAVLSKITKDGFVAGLTAVLFCIHPINAENLAHITLNIVFVMALFLLASLWSLHAYIPHPEKKYRLSLSVFLFILALLCHAAALLFLIYAPLLILLIHRRALKETLRTVMPHITAGVLFVLVWLFYTSPSVQLAERWRSLDITPFEFSANIFRLAWWYLAKIIDARGIVFMYNALPTRQNVFLINLAAAGLFALIVLGFARKRTYFLEWFALGVFLAGFLLMVPASIGRPSMGLVVEPHWFFLNLAGALLLASLLIRRVTIKPLQYLLIGILAAHFGLQTVHLKKIFRSELTYAENWLERSPGNFIAQRIAGTLYIYGDDPVPEKFIGAMLALTGDYQKYKNYNRALLLLKKIIANHPALASDMDISARLAVVYYQNGLLTESAAVADALLKDAGAPGPYLLLADAFHRQNLPQRALEITETCLQSYPHAADAYFLKGVYLGNMQRLAEAIQAWQKAQELDPANEAYQSYLDKAEDLMSTGK